MSIEKLNKHGKLLNIFLPVLIGLFLLFLFYKVYLLFNPLDPYKDGDGALFFDGVLIYILLPFTSVILFLLQRFIVLPLWNKLISSFSNVFLASISVCMILSISLGILIGYLFWAKQFGLSDLYFSILITTCIVMAYNIINIFTLYFINKSQISRLKSHI
jgi:hypothetical protein